MRDPCPECGQPVQSEFISEIITLLKGESVAFCRGLLDELRHEARRAHAASQQAPPAPTTAPCSFDTPPL